MKGMAILCAVMVFTLAACGGSGGTPAADSEVQREADTYAIDQLRRRGTRRRRRRTST